MKVVALAGGVGGAKLADGLGKILSKDLTVVVNTGDDFDHLGLKICPDLDTVCYTLAGLANPETGWGQKDETWNALGSVSRLGGPDWFRIGDHDLGTHLERTRRLAGGLSLSNITRDFCVAWGIAPVVLPMSDDLVPTVVLSDEGALPFQEYFVHRQCQPRVKGFRFERVEKARPAPGVISAIKEASLVVICPSNPWVSIDPILSIRPLRMEIESKIVIAISPIIGGAAVKGPAAKMYREMGIEPSPLSVARHYGEMLDGFVFDHVDADFEAEIKHMGVIPWTAQTLMRNPKDRSQLAREVLSFGERLISDKI